MTDNPHFFRMTRQRRVILDEIVRSKDHPTANEIYLKVRKKLPSISLATVYRNLDCLVEAGRVSKLATDQKEWRFDGNPEEHLHVTCLGCGKIRDIPDQFSPSVPYPSQDNGMAVVTHRLEYLGYCNECSDENRSSLTEEQKVVLNVLEYRAEKTFSQIHEETQLPTTTIRNSVYALILHGRVERTATDSFRLRRN